VKYPIKLFALNDAKKAERTALIHAFGYNSAKRKPIWMKSGTVWAKCWGWP